MRTRIRRFIGFAVALGLVTGPGAFAASSTSPIPTRTVGRTYPIAEPDFFEEVVARAKQVDWAKMFDENKWKDRFRNYQPPNLARFPRAQTPRVRYVTPTATLPFDIPGPDGRIAYPKGMPINPLEHITLTYRYLIFDASDPDQLAWVQTLAGVQDPGVRILLSGGNYWDTMKTLGKRVYYLTTPFAERLAVQAVPCLIAQEGTQLRIQEFAVPQDFAQATEATKEK